MGNKVTYSELEHVLSACFQQAQASGIPVDGSILWEKSLKIVATIGIKNFPTRLVGSSASSFAMPVFKKLARESALIQKTSKDTEGV
jgi:hypothetical protein